MVYNFKTLTRSITSVDIARYKKRYTKDVLNYYKVQLKSLIIVEFFIVTPFLLAFFFQETEAHSTGGYSLANGLGIFSIILSIMIFVLFYLLTCRKIKYNIKIQRFANANDLIYEPCSCVDLNYPGMIFNIGQDHLYKEKIKSKSGVSFEISNYSYTIANGNRRQVIEKGYIMVGLDRNLPNIVLDSNKNNFNLFGMKISNLPVNFKNNQKLMLEGDFNNYFTLYAPKDYERDALYIFTPDLMALFIDSLSVFDAEIVDDKLFIYSERFDMTNPETLNKVFKIIDAVGNKIVLKTEDYRDEKFFNNLEKGVISKGGIRLIKKSVPVFVVVMIIMFILEYYFFIKLWFVYG